MVIAVPIRRRWTAGNLECIMNSVRLLKLHRTHSTLYSRPAGHSLVMLSMRISPNAAISNLPIPSQLSTPPQPPRLEFISKKNPLCHNFPSPASNPPSALVLLSVASSHFILPVPCLSPASLPAFDRFCQQQGR